MKTKQFVLTSSPFYYTPGIVKWACADVAARRSFLRKIFPGLTPAALTALVEGRYTVDETAETVTVEG
jgi:hypothetical protein